MYSDWLTCKKHLLDLGFEESKIEEACQGVTLTEEKGFLKKPRFGKYEVVEESTYIYITERKGRWSSTTRKLGVICRVAAQYQGLQHEKILRKLLEDRFPYLKEFSFPLYEMQNEDHEIYIKTESDSLYVPLKALVSNDWSLIEKRMNDYLSWYYNTKPDKKEKQLENLTTPTALKLKNILDGLRKNSKDLK